MRRTISLLFVFAAAAILAAPGSADAVAWVTPEGKDSVTFFTGYSYFDEIYNGDGDTVELTDEVSLFDVGVLWEHGMRENMSFSIFFPYSYAERGKDALIGGIPEAQQFEEQYGISDVRFDLKWNFLLSPVALAVKAGVKMPGDYDPAQLATFGDGQHDIDVTFILSKFFVNRLLLNVDLGYRFRYGDKDDEVFGQLDFGVQTTRRLMILANVQFVDSFGGFDLGEPGARVFAATEEDQYNAGLTFSITPAENWNIFVQGLTSIAGKNTSKETRFNFGFGYTL